MNRKSLLVFTIVCACASNAFCQRVDDPAAKERIDPFKSQTIKTDEDPFGGSPAVSRESKKKRKVVIDTDTLDLCILWLDTARSIAYMKNELSRSSHKISEYADLADSDEKQKRIAKEESRKKKLNEKISQARAMINRIPYDNTFDLMRFERFKHDLKNREDYLAMDLQKQQHILRRMSELEKENELMRQQIAELKSK